MTVRGDDLTLIRLYLLLGLMQLISSQLLTYLLARIVSNNAHVWKRGTTPTRKIRSEKRQQNDNDGSNNVPFIEFEIAAFRSIGLQMDRRHWFAPPGVWASASSCLHLLVTSPPHSNAHATVQPTEWWMKHARQGESSLRLWLASATSKATASRNNWTDDESTRKHVGKVSSRHKIHPCIVLWTSAK